MNFLLINGCGTLENNILSFEVALVSSPNIIIVTKNKLTNKCKENFVFFFTINWDHNNKK